MSCIVPGCKNKKKAFYEKPVSFHRFPTNILLAKKWAIALGIYGKCKFKNKFVCSAHFDESSYKPNADGKRLLWEDAVPIMEDVPVPQPQISPPLDVTAPIEGNSMSDLLIVREISYIDQPSSSSVAPQNGVNVSHIEQPSTSSDALQNEASISYVEQPSSFVAFQNGDSISHIEQPSISSDPLQNAANISCKEEPSTSFAASQNGDNNSHFEQPSISSDPLQNEASISYTEEPTVSFVASQNESSVSNMDQFLTNLVTELLTSSVAPQDEVGNTTCQRITLKRPAELMESESISKDSKKRKGQLLPQNMHKSLKPNILQ